MARVRDVLYRFRPAGAPGAASAAGVPVDRAADLAAELEPLLAQLATTERTVAGIREQAIRDAAEIRARDVERARSIVTTAGQRADAERAAAAAQMRRRAEGEAAGALADAEREAAELGDRAAARIPAYVALVVDSVSRLVGDEHPAGAR